jgi:Zn-dependent protease with chaperone function
VSDWLEPVALALAAVCWLLGAVWRAVRARIRQRGAWRVALEAGVLYAALAAVSGCRQGPTGPTAGPDVDAALRPAWERLQAVPRIGPWAAGVPVRSIVLTSRMYPGYTAETLSGGVIRVHPQALTMHPDELTAILAHELRHVEGVYHHGPEWCDRPGERGAWAVHIETLEILGRQASADYLREHKTCR